MDVKAALDEAIAVINAGIGARIENAVTQRDQRWRAKLDEVVAQKIAAAVAARDGHWQAFIKDALETRDAEWREMTGHTGEFPPTPDDMTDDEEEFGRASAQTYTDNVVAFPGGKRK